MRSSTAQHSAILIEDKANGTAIIEDLKNMKGLHGVLAVNPEGGKMARGWAAQPTLEANNVWLPDPEAFPETALWVGEFIDHCCKFPNTDDDHDVDAFTQGVAYLKKYGGAIFAPHWRSKPSEGNGDQSQARRHRSSGR
jgi:predicted phage terminase large subunit-like protein